MHRGSPIMAVLVMVAFWVAALYIPIGTLYAQDGEKAPAYTYMGVKKCKTCHNMKKYGAQYKVWIETAHAKAYEALQSEAAAAIAKEKGLEKPANETPECLACHTTGHGASAEVRGTKLTAEEGISCEACHGPGSGYYKKKTMTGLSDGSIEPASVGLTLPDEKTCVGCHNEKSPTYKEFDFKTFWEKIKHSKPEAK